MFKLSPEEARQNWVEALRSGEYEQGKAVLRTGDNRYCCLGVACDLLRKLEGIGHWDTSTLDFVVSSRENGGVFEKRSGSLPLVACKWLGGVSHCGRLNDGSNYLDALNDEGKTFSEIANLIESGDLALDSAFTI